MPHEIESKMRLRDRAGLVAKLERLAGPAAAELIETDVFLDTADQRLRRGDCGLRVRVEEDQKRPGRREIVVTYKGPRESGRWKNREEIELGVTDKDKAIAVLSRLGFEPRIEIQKRRVRWTVGGCRVELDSLPYLGEFVEVEGASEEAVTAVLQELGLQEEPMVKESYVAMLHAHLEANGIASRVLRLER